MNADRVISVSTGTENAPEKSSWISPALLGVLILFVGILCQFLFASELFLSNLFVAFLFWTSLILLYVGILQSVQLFRLKRKIHLADLRVQQLGRYTLGKKIGAGAMGVVYQARHSLLNRPTAVKLLDHEKANEETIARFEREVQLSSQLNHPNTIAIYDFGRTSEGLFYYAMEYLDGITLEDLVLLFGPLPEGRVISVLDQVCGSLSEAHGVGLIHRDIKPPNIMIGERGGIFDFVKLLDFGLAKSLNASTQITLNAHQGVRGTPLYLSPEGIETPKNVDARSDLYSLGLVGYFLLAGKPVFEGKSFFEICLQHTRRKPKRPSEKRGKPISQDLEEVILRCLEKKQDDRFQSAKEFQKALLSCSAAGDWTQVEAEKWWIEYRSQTPEDESSFFGFKKPFKPT